MCNNYAAILVPGKNNVVLNDEAYLCVSSDVKQHCGEDID
jgi:hypothetical protein